MYHNFWGVTSRTTRKVCEKMRFTKNIKQHICCEGAFCFVWRIRAYWFLALFGYPESNFREIPFAVKLMQADTRRSCLLGYSRGTSMIALFPSKKVPWSMSRGGEDPSRRKGSPVF